MAAAGKITNLFKMDILEWFKILKARD